MENEIEFVRDRWVRVRAHTADDARKFFGAPTGWPVKFVGFDTRVPGRIWAVLAEGLEIC
jgi:hypothetical protein